MSRKPAQSSKAATKAPKPSRKASKAVETEEQAMLRYWEQHSGTDLTHYLNFGEFKAGWQAAYAYNAEG